MMLFVPIASILLGLAGYALDKLLLSQFFLMPLGVLLGYIAWAKARNAAIRLGKCGFHIGSVVMNVIVTCLISSFIVGSALRL